jgi:hypothetical protein
MLLHVAAVAACPCSLSWFIALFKRSLAGAARSEVLGKRLDTIGDHFTQAVYHNICR